MRKIIVFVSLIFLLTLVSGCSNNKGIEIRSTIVDKKVVESNQYYFLVTYRMENMEELFEATIKVNKSTFDRYSIGDIYIFYRPAQ